MSYDTFAVPAHPQKYFLLWSSRCCNVRWIVFLPPTNRTKVSLCCICIACDVFEDAIRFLCLSLTYFSGSILNKPNLRKFNNNNDDDVDDDDDDAGGDGDDSDDNNQIILCVSFQAPNLLSPAEEQRVTEILQDMADKVRKRRLMVYPYFKDFDRVSFVPCYQGACKLRIHRARLVNLIGATWGGDTRCNIARNRLQSARDIWLWHLISPNEHKIVKRGSHWSRNRFSARDIWLWHLISSNEHKIVKRVSDRDQSQFDTTGYWKRWCGKQLLGGGYSSSIACSIARNLCVVCNIACIVTPCVSVG